MALTILLFLLAGGVAPAADELIPERDGHRVVPSVRAPTDELVARLRLPDGFRITKFAEGLGSPRMLAVGDDGTVYATRPSTGEVLALRDEDGDDRVDVVRAVVHDLPRVHGIALHGGAMYLATVDTVYRAAMNGRDVAPPEKLFGGLPPGGRHPNRTLGFSPDGALFVSVGSTCNACVEESPESATILCAAADGSGRKVFASGLRNTIGFGWHPTSGEMWGMDHGTDWLGDDFPPEELNRLEEGKFYGWPFVHGADSRPLEPKPPRKGVDPKSWVTKTTRAVLGYTAHAAPIQMAFYGGTQFPEAYRNDAFVAMHGSWNRKPPAGFEVVRIDFEGGRPVAFQPFVTGFLIDESTTFGRPAGIAVAKDGALLVGDDATGVVYRVTYSRP